MPKRAKEITLAELIGARMRAIRNEAEATQEDVAAYAREFGLAWKRNTIAQLELGLQEPTAGELLLLPLVMARIARRPIELRDLLAHEDPRAVVGLGGASGVFHGYLQWVVEGNARKVDPVLLTVAAGEELGFDEATEKAARRLGITAAHVHFLARQFWDRSLVDEREARLQDHPSWPAANARSRQALRGLVTRQLLEELEPHARPEED